MNPSVCGCVQIHRGLQALSMIAEHLTRYRTLLDIASTSQAITVQEPTSLLAISINDMCMHITYNNSSSSSVYSKTGVVDQFAMACLLLAGHNAGCGLLVVRGWLKWSSLHLYGVLCLFGMGEGSCPPPKTVTHRRPSVSGLWMLTVQLCISIYFPTICHCSDQV